MVKLVSTEVIATKIFVIRGKRVMLDSDLAILYGAKTKRLNEQVMRNKKRFPEDFMFQLTEEEANFLRSHFATSKRGGRRYLPYVFTQEGVAMLSSVLNSERAIMVNIQIMRAFAQFRRLLLTHKDLRRKIEEMEKKYDAQFKVVFDALKKLLEPPAVEKRRIIGFRAGNDS
ncbi:MAG: ORF6N domain-containing protein [Candidatus Omnitrophica bacterium]|nr:ORF6N domain-containing protein [Candidatus Omnitrophota bacterium]